jgi:predicted nucleic acid-binding protein
MSEMVHVLSRKSGSDTDFVTHACELLLRLGLRTLGLDEKSWKQAAAWSGQGMSGYDATYAALAASLNGRWLTADARAADKLGALAAPLANWSAPA